MSCEGMRLNCRRDRLSCTKLKPQSRILLRCLLHDSSYSLFVRSTSTVDGQPPSITKVCKVFYAISLASAAASVQSVGLPPRLPQIHTWQRRPVSLSVCTALPQYILCFTVLGRGELVANAEFLCCMLQVCTAACGSTEGLPGPFNTRILRHVGDQNC